MSAYLSPARYLPHEAPMVLLDQVISVTNTEAHCQVKVTHQSILKPFLDATGQLPSWFALELMAQTVGVWSGWHRLTQGKEHISLGMILGARELLCQAATFPTDTTLDIRVTLLMQDERIGSFDTEILCDGQRFATGRINTFQPSATELTQLFTQE